MSVLVRPGSIAACRPRGIWEVEQPRSPCSPSVPSALFVHDHQDHQYGLSPRMADVIGILSFALHAAHKVYDIVQTIKDAPDAVRALGKEASRVKGLLTVMLPQPNGEPSPLLRNDGNPLVKSLVEDAQELETAVEALLAKAVRRKEDGTHAVRKSRWVFYAGEAEKLSAQFQKFHGSLTAVYVVMTS